MTTTDDDNWLEGEPTKLLDKRGALVNKAELAKILGWTLYRVDAALKRGAPYHRQGNEQHEWQIYVGDFWRWLIAEERGAINTDAPAAALLDAKTRATLAKAVKLEAENAEQRSNLVTIDQVVTVYREETAIVRKHLLALPAALAPRLSAETDASKAERIIEDGIQDALRLISTEGV